MTLKDHVTRLVASTADNITLDADRAPAERSTGRHRYEPGHTHVDRLAPHMIALHRQNSGSAR